MDNLSELFKQCSIEMSRRGQLRFADCFFAAEIDNSIAELNSLLVKEVQQLFESPSIDPVHCLMEASITALFPSQQPPKNLPIGLSCKQYLLHNLEHREYCIRAAQLGDLPELILLEESCWVEGLRTPAAVLKQRISSYPEGQLVLTLNDSIVGVIYSQCIETVDVLQGVSSDAVDTLHTSEARVVQLLAVNIVPEMQQKNLGDQLLEFMLIYRSLQQNVQSVVAVTLCKNFDRSASVSLDDYIQVRNEHGALADPILRFHELHGAKIERVMPNYRPSDHKNKGCGVLVSYDIHNRSRDELQLDPALRETQKKSCLTSSDIRTYVKKGVCACLGEQRKSSFSFERPLMEMGLDSADFLELSEKIVYQYQLPLTTTFLFQYNTAEKIIAYLCEQLVIEQQQDAENKTHKEQQRTLAGALKSQTEYRKQDVAIIGMACRLPGGIDTPEALWQCLQDGSSVITELPGERWQWPDDIDLEHQHMGINRGGFLDNIAEFDAPFFRLSPAEAEVMDPQQRILLELSWQAIEQAGYAQDSLTGSNTGVFIGASGSDYARLLDQSSQPVTAHYGTGNSMAVLANRISYFYDFHGSSLLLDTACSSSLVAVHKAVQSIQTGESSQALVGGINLICHPANSIAYYKAGMLAKDGYCKTFDQQADGYVRSEGAVMLLLKPLTTAITDGDQIHAVIKSTASNHGGQASGLTVPNPEQQVQLMKTAWQAADIDPLILGYIEAHGTGTSLGDPIEVQSLKQAFSQARAQSPTQAKQSCGIGSVKTNLGHLEAAAGITGLLKTVLCLQHRQLPATVHFNQLNEHISLSDSGLYIVDRLQPWPTSVDGGARLAGVSSFGSGGSNAHVILAEYPSLANQTRREAVEPLVFVLSAKTKKQLQIYVQKYVDWLRLEINQSLPLESLIYTLQTGRQAMAERLALVVTDHQDLLRQLLEFSSNPEQTRKLTEGEEESIRSLVAQRDWNKIAQIWLSGGEVDWSLLYAAEDKLPGKINAPTYPFAKHSYWLPDTELVVDSITLGESAAVKIDPIILAPVWRALTKGEGTFSDNGLFPKLDARILIVGGTAAQQQAIRSVYVTALLMDIDSEVTIESLTQQLKRLGNLQHIIWIAPESNLASAINKTLVEQQNLGLLYVFKLVKGLLALSYGNGDMGLTVISCRTQMVFNQDATDPAHAGVHGLIGALAKEYPRWHIRALDMENSLDWPVREIMSLASNSQGETLAYRSGQWFRRFLSPLQRLPESTPAYRQQGVYVVIGGAGGIGEAWSRFVIQHYQAQLIWIGRRKLDAAIQAKLDTLAELGAAPVYLSVDAANFEALQVAYTTIKQSYPVIHGVIHSAVGLFDHSIAEMNEPRFRDILSAKIDISVYLAQVFKDEMLDFILYFSSTVALDKNGGLSGYAAGGAFEDAFALHLAKQSTCAVKVINWGHWDIGTGDVISAASKTRLQLSGIIPIQPEEAMPVLQTLLTGSLNQIALLKTARPEVLSMIDANQYLSIYQDTIPRSIEQIPLASKHIKNRVDTLKALSIFNNTTLEEQLLPLFAGTLQSLGLLDESGQSQQKSVAGFYRQWLTASQNLLAEQNFQHGASVNLDALWLTWEQVKQKQFYSSDMVAAIELLEACLQALPDILHGDKAATDIIFPDSSMRRVEGIYRNNAVADYFNQALAESLIAGIKARLKQDPNVQLRILEIGAGAGGTTAIVLPMLAEYQNNIAEYAYTDVSKAFLFYAEEQFVDQYPFVRPQLFDVEKSLLGQGIKEQHYDVVIATNVLHATRNIRQTLANAKAALHKNGLLLLNEISNNSLFAHVTFGLLEGWWLSEDPQLRIPDAPGLYPDVWQQVLQQEGFATVMFPNQAAHILGQQIIIAESDGVVLQQKELKIPRPQINELSNHQEQGSSLSDETLKQASNFHLKKLVARTLRMDSRDVDALEPLESYGIDSILVVQISNALREVFADVSSTLLFECQNIDALSDYFINNSKEALIRFTSLQDYKQSPRNNQSSTEKLNNNHRTSRHPDPKSEAGLELEPIAVIGMSGRFPQADTVNEYWQLLKTGKDCIQEIPQDRWSLQGFFHADPDEAVQQGKSYSKWGGFLDRVTDFDPLFFNISPKEAITIDPQERLFLQTTWEALEDAGYTRERLINQFQQQVGVFAGITRTGFDLFGPQLWQQGQAIYPHTSFSSVANRVSYFLNARGPSVPVDTMCSSSLTAIHQACQSLRSGECQLAIAGGVNIYLHPSGYVGLSASRMLSKDGMCRSFGKGGNGFVPGEGVGVVLLKPLSKAIRDNDQIYATIRGSHINHGGKTNGYTVPNPHAQADLIKDALQKSGVDAREVSYMEAHGTGTELGDPIEVSGLTQAFQHDTQETGFCALGSAKSNLGHLEAAAGIAGFIKVILQMRYKQIAPSLHATELNPNINFDKTPFVIQQKLTDWKRPLLERQGELKEQPRIAGISSFGAGGANAHVIVEEYLQQQSLTPGESQTCLVVLSAKNEDRLKAYASKLYDFIDSCLDKDNVDFAAPDLSDLAYTLQVGREQMDERMALVVQSLDQLSEKLGAYINAEGDIADLYQGKVKDHKDVLNVFADDDAIQKTVETWFKQGKYSRLLKLWAKGMTIDWESLYQGENFTQRRPRRISLPTYSFAATRYWLPLTESANIQLNANTQLEVTIAQANIEQSVLDKPSNISLHKPALLPTMFQDQTTIAQVNLRPLQKYALATDINTASLSSEETPRIKVYDYGEDIFAIEVKNVAGQTIEVGSACAGINRCLQLVADQQPAAKVLLLTGLDKLFPSDNNAAASQSIYSIIASIADCIVPVIAVMAGENRHDAMLIASVCDVMLCSEEGSYSFFTATISEQEYQLFADRFGKNWAEKVLSSAQVFSGSALRQAGLTIAIIKQTELDETVLATAHNIAQASNLALTELKIQLSARIRQLIKKLSNTPSLVAKEKVSETTVSRRLDSGFVWPPKTGVADAETPEPVYLDSAVVTLQKYSNGVLLMNLCDRSSKNTFSPEFVSGVIAAFEHINHTPEYKVVVLTGYDNYFACGGTKQGLLAIQNGSTRFTDEQSYSMPLSCKIPVIAAMQGHAIGAGWAMGLFCDWAVYSEESVYQSPYMLYGFTPGAGSTLIFPQRLGHDLSREILLTAREFQGRELFQRGIDMPVMPRSEVLGYTLALAKHLALSSQQLLIEQKNLRSQSIRQQLQSVFSQELAMHEKTFVGNQVVIDNLHRHFNEGLAESELAQIKSDNVQPFSHSESDWQSREELLKILRQSLTEELQMQRENVDDNVAFIDMGLDSITAVTWIRKINKQFGLSLGATKVYSYPTLTLFTDLVWGETSSQQRLAVVDEAVAVDENGKQLLAWLRETLAKELLMTQESLDDDMKFIDMGLDSITAVTWVRVINKHYGLDIGATKIYSYPTLAEFYQYLLKAGNIQGLSQDSEQPQSNDYKVQAIVLQDQSQLMVVKPVLLQSFDLAVDSYQPLATEQEQATSHTCPEVEPEKKPHKQTQNNSTQSIAIIGMAGQFPKADNLKQFWQNLAQGRDCISDIPDTRWAIDEYYHADRNEAGKTVCKRMGLLDNIDVFDPLFFNISPSEAEYMDPQQRLFLQSSWQCIEDAGYNPAELSGSLCGVFVGCEAGDYNQLMTGHEQSAHGLMGASVAMLPARIAYFLNLQGPCLAIDTACSSSLVALSNACDSLLLGNSDLALAGGVYVINGPDIHVKMSKAGMLSPDGCCFSFDQRANGFVPGEGVGVLLLKRLEQAEQDGDDIYGVIRGWGVNQDGKSNGITAPNQESQTQLETSVYEKFAINPEHIQLIEAHGTATKLGDPIEIDALRESFSKFTNKQDFCALSSVKSNIGHLATAAGVSGVIKSVLALQHKILPPTINYQTLNEHINLQDSPFYVNTQCKPWDTPVGQKRLVAVSSFGFSGTNAHMVLEESAQYTAISLANTVADDVPVLLVLSAKSKQQLVVYAQAVSDYFANEYNSQEISLIDIAYTFQTGRTAMHYRLAVVGNSVDEITAGLLNYATSVEPGEACFIGEASKNTAVDSVDNNKSATQQTLTEEYLGRLAMCWVKGGSVDWQTLYQARQVRRRHGLPTYPFAREHYWVPEVEATEEVADSLPSQNKEPEVISELWKGSELSDTINWQSQLQHYQSKNVVFVYSDEEVRQGFSELLRQLHKAAGLASTVNITYYTVSELSAELAAKQPDCLLFLAGDGKQHSKNNISAISQSLNLFVDKNNIRPKEMVFFLQSSQVESDRLAELINTTVKNKQNCTLVTQVECGDTDLIIQRLVKEWLASDAQNSLKQIHYLTTGQRLLRVGGVEQVSNQSYLITKDWLVKDPQPLDQPIVSGAVLILVNHESLGIAKKLIETEDFKESVLIGDDSFLPNQIQNLIDYKDAELARISANILIDEYGDIRHIIDLSDLYGTDKDSDADNPGKTVFYQTLISTYNDIAILYFTKGLQYFQCSDMSLAGAKFAGLVKMLSADYPHVSARFIDIDQSVYEQPLQLKQIVLQEFNAELQETELCYRNGQRYAPVLSVVDTEDGQHHNPLPIAQDGTYVISGGTNGVGLEIAKYLAAKGCNNLVLMGVTELPPREKWQQVVNNDELPAYIKNKLLKLIELDKLVEHLQVYTGSLTSQYSLRRYFKKIRTRLGPIKGIIHSAGVYSNPDKPGFVSKQLEQMQEVWAPKINGLESLHTLFKTDALDFFVSFSSMTGVMPHLARGACDYAMANSFVDFFNAYQHHQNSNTHYKTIIWSDWNQTGAITRVADDKVAEIENNFRQLGMRTFSNQEGCSLFEQAMTCTADSRVFISYLDLQQFNKVRPQLLYANLNTQEIAVPSLSCKAKPAIELTAEKILLNSLEQWEAEKRVGQEISANRITDVISLDQIKQLEPELIHRIHKLLLADIEESVEKNETIDLEQLITQTVQDVLKLKSFDPSQPFQNYGLDSISAMVLATRLEKKLNQPVQPQWLIEFSTVESLSKRLSESGA